MDQTEFDGQQDGERILYTIREHPLTTYLAYVTIAAVSLSIIAITWLISRTYMYTGSIIATGGFVFGLLILGLGSFWIKRRHEKTVSYITDRRIMRFEAVSPFYVAKRALFWNEAMKAKVYTNNLFWRLLNIGTLVVETQVPEQGDVRIPNVYYFEDLGNYIDKILYLFKNTPHEITGLRPFVPKPKGKRG